MECWLHLAEIKWDNDLGNVLHGDYTTISDSYHHIIQHSFSYKSDAYCSESSSDLPAAYPYRKQHPFTSDLTLANDSAKVKKPYRQSNLLVIFYRIFYYCKNGSEQSTKMHKLRFYLIKMSWYVPPVSNVYFVDTSICKSSSFKKRLKRYLLGWPSFCVSS